MSIQRYLLGSGYATGSQTFSATGTFTAPQGVYAVTVQCWAGGGFAQSVLTIIPGTSYTVTVGTGGGLDTNGGDSWFSSAGTITAYGGFKGNNVTNGIGV